MPWCHAVVPCGGAMRWCHAVVPSGACGGRPAALGEAAASRTRRARGALARRSSPLPRAAA
eukprot:5446722-Prymnesium_polylepis.1